MEVFTIIGLVAVGLFAFIGVVTICDELMKEKKDDA